MNGNYLFFLSESHIHCNWMVLGVTREMQTDFSNEWTWPQTLNKQSLNLCNRSKFLKFALKPKKLNLILSCDLQCYYRVTMFGVIIVVFISQIRTTLPSGSDTHQQRCGELHWARRCLNIMQKNCFNFLFSSPQGPSWKKNLNYRNVFRSSFDLWFQFEWSHFNITWAAVKRQIRQLMQGVR